MNKKGFTLVELLATIVILSIVAGIVVILVSGNIGKTKEKSEKIFIGTIKDAMDMYLDSDARKLSFNTAETCFFSKALKNNVKLYKAKNDITFSDVINSKYTPISTSEFVNPYNEVKCETMERSIEIYRDEDFVYYYRINKDVLDCFEVTASEGYISNLPDFSKNSSTNCNLG